MGRLDRWMSQKTCRTFLFLEELSGVKVFKRTYD